MFSSWSIQSPSLLYALFGLLVPLIIHLLSKSKGRLVPIGNIKLIQTGKPVRMREVRLVERLLLLCRLLVLLFSILIVAKLLFHGQISQSNNAVLITLDWLNETDQQEKGQLIADEQGSDFYLLSKVTSDESFSANRRLSEQDILLWQLTHKTSANSNENNTWALLSNFEKSLPVKTYIEQANTEKSINEKTELTVYSTNRMAEFSGEKVKFSNSINWKIKQLENKSLEAFLKIKQGEISVAVITDADRQQDLIYLRAALNVLKLTRLPNLNIVYFDDVLTYQNVYTDSIQNKLPQWIFYLSSSPVPKNLLAQVKQGAQLIVDAKKSDAQQEKENSLAFSATSAKQIWQVESTKHNLSLIKGFSYGEPALPSYDTMYENFTFQVLWKAIMVNNTVDKKLLVEYIHGAGKIIAFHSRFNPNWNDLVAQPQFSHFILSLFLSEKLESAEQQQGQLTPSQISETIIELPADNHFSSNSGQFVLKENDQQIRESWFNQILIILLILFFAIERILSEIKSAKKARIAAQAEPTKVQSNIGPR